MAADFQNVYHYNVCLCSLVHVVLADVLELNCSPAGENELSFFGQYLCFFFFFHSGFQRASARATSWKKIWMLIAGFPDEIWMLQQPKEEIVAFFSKKGKQFSKSFDSTTGSSAAMNLVDMICTQTPAR